MIIKKINLLSFGKFKEKEINLDENINLIYGKNEDGKSTIHSFIEGVLYGFSKDSLKRRLYTEKLDKYKPWNSEIYRGYIEIEDGDLFRIERDFARDETKILNLTRGQNLSEDKNLFKDSKVSQPGQIFLDINSEVFRNTLFINEDSLLINQNAKEFIGKKIINQSSSLKNGDRGINAVKILKDQIKKLGDRSLRSSEIGKIYSQINDKKTELLNLEDKLKLYRENLKNLNELEEKIGNLSEKIEKADLQEEFETFNRVKELKKELENLKEIKTIDREKYEKVILLNKKIHDLENRMDFLQEKSIENLEENFPEKDFKDDYEKAQKLFDRLRQLNSRNYSQEIIALKNDVSNLETKQKSMISLMSLQGIVILAIIILSIIFKIYPLLILTLPSGIYIYLRIIKYRVSRDVYKRLKDRIEIMSQKSREKQAEKKNMDTFFISMFEKYGADNIEDLENIFRAKIAEKKLEEYKIETAKKEKRDYEEELLQLKSQRDESLKNLEIYLNDLGFDNIYELKNAFSESDSEKGIRKRREDLKNLIDIKLRGRNFESLNKKDLNLDFDGPLLKEKLNNLNLKLSELNRDINYLEKYLDRAQKLSEDLEVLEKDLEDREEKLNVYSLTLEALEGVLEKNKSNYLPRLIEETSKLFETISGGKYKNLNLDDNLNLSVFDRENGRSVELSSLSKGTCDQVYFVFRIALCKFISKKNLPLFIDNVFGTFDDDRLKFTYETLKEISKERQVIIFSSSKRDYEKAVEFNIKRIEL